jgi:hypothetical protein
VSGTAEEIDRAIELGKFVHVWFSNEDLPRNADLDQVARLRQFREDLGKRGLLRAAGSGRVSAARRPARGCSRRKRPYRACAANAGGL